MFPMFLVYAANARLVFHTVLVCLRREGLDYRKQILKHIPSSWHLRVTESRSGLKGFASKGE